MTSHWKGNAAALQTREQREEALWIARAKTGDEAAFRWILEPYRSRVVRLAAHVLRRDSAQTAGRAWPKE